jgi:hypothetical protein
MTPSDPYPGKPAVELSMGQRQIAALGFVAFLLLAFVATIAYLAGRVASPSKDDAVVASKRPLPSSAPSTQVLPPAPNQAAARGSSPVEQLILVEPAAASRPSLEPASVMAARAAEPPKELFAPPPKPKTPELKPVPADLLSGNSFWQVAATELGMSEVSCEFLTRKGLPALIADGPSAGIFRVLVGPIKNPGESQKFKAALDEAGFHPFLKKY